MDAVIDVEIKNVRKNNDGEITHVGVKGRWEVTVAEVVASIEGHTNTFYISSPQRAKVYLARTTNGRKMLRTTADTTARNNLELLPSL